MRKKVHPENRCAATVFRVCDAVFIMKEIVTFCMKGCFTIQKNKKICAIIVLILAIIAFVGLAIMAIVAPMQYSKPVAGVAENDFTFPEVIGNGSDGFAAHTQTSAAIPATTGVVFESGKLEQTIDLCNPSENPCAFVISLYLGDGTRLFQTEPIYPGDAVSTVILSQELSCGHYSDAVIVYDCYSADGAMKPLTRCELVIEITSQ